MEKPLLHLMVALAAVMALAVGCVSTGIDSYKDFRSAVDSGATCAQLIDMRTNFNDRPKVQDKVDADLEEIGCTNADAERTDQ